MKYTIEKEEGVEKEIIIRCSAVDDEIKELLEWLRNKDKMLKVQGQGVMKKINPRNILYCEVVDRKVFIYTKESVETTHYTLLELEEMFKTVGFVRCSKSMVINIEHIAYLKTDISGRIIATLANDEKIMISRHYAKVLRKLLME